MYQLSGLVRLKIVFLEQVTTSQLYSAASKPVRPPVTACFSLRNFRGFEWFKNPLSLRNYNSDWDFAYHLFISTFLAVTAFGAETAPERRYALLKK